jgi:hypothetical protein
VDSGHNSKRASTICKEINESWELVKHGAKWVIGNGKHGWFWQDAWVTDKPLKHSANSHIHPSKMDDKVSD